MDYNGDGKTDICLININGLYVYEFTGDGFRQLAYSSAINIMHFNFESGTIKDRELMVADMNGDGNMDIILGSRRVHCKDGFKHFGDGICHGACDSESNLKSVSASGYKHYVHPYSGQECMVDPSVPQRDLVVFDWNVENGKQWKFLLSTGNSSYSSANPGFKVHTEELFYCFHETVGQNFMLVDVDSDGLPDLLRNVRGKIYLHLNENGKISQNYNIRSVLQMDNLSAQFAMANVAQSYYWSGGLICVDNENLHVYDYSHNESEQRMLHDLTDSYGVTSNHYYMDIMKVLEKKMADGGDIDSISHEYAELSSYFEARDGYRIDVKIKQVLNGMGFGSTPTDRVISTLSGGEKTRLALAKLLLEEPNLLILDEPTNHLDFETLMWLEDYLKGYKDAIIIVSHDRYFLNKVCTRICEIEQGRLTSYRGDYSSYLVQKKMNSERQLKEYEAQQKEIAKLEDYVAKNLVRASTSKMAKSRQHMLDRIERIDKPLMYSKPPKIKLEYDIEPTKDIVRVVDCPLVVGEGADKKELIKSLTMNVRRGEHVAIIGANGIGKTSILKLIQGIIPHEGGNISWGGNVKISYFEQEHAILDPRKTVLEEIMDRYPRLSEQQARSVLGAVLLTGENVFKPISVLSGGERAKLCFAIMALNRGNVLVLDEPTNHLDLNTKEVLEDALAEFGGTIILVSHDRYLLNKVASRIIEIRHDEVNSYEGNFDAYSEAVNAARQLKMQSEAEIKRAEEEKAYKENKARQYRSKEQRAADAQKRNRIRELEKEIEDTEVLIFELENAISDPEIASDYSKMSEKCKELEEAKTALDQKMDEWAELSDQLS